MKLLPPIERFIPSRECASNGFAIFILRWYWLALWEFGLVLTNGLFVFGPIKRVARPNIEPWPNLFPVPSEGAELGVNVGGYGNEK